MRSRVSEILSGFIDMIAVGLLWLLFSLPVFTLGAASSALYYAVVKCIRHNRASPVKTFIKGFRENLRRAVAVWLLIIIYVLLGITNIYALGQIALPFMPFLRDLCLLLLLFPLFFFPWIFACLSRFEIPLRNSLKLAFWLMLKNPLSSLLLALELSAFLLVCWLLPLLIPLLPGAVCLTMSLSIEPVFRPLQQDIPDRTDSWFNE